MSASAVKVSSDKQTLILAGEPVPPSRGSGEGSFGNRSDLSVRMQRVTVLVMQGDYATAPLAADLSPARGLAGPSERLLLPPVAAVEQSAVLAQSLVPYTSSNRALSAGAAEYARTQNLPDGGARRQLIDTYA
jgi:hypothetical protein